MCSLSCLRRCTRRSRWVGGASRWVGGVSLGSKVKGGSEEGDRKERELTWGGGVRGLLQPMWIMEFHIYTPTGSIRFKEFYFF